jgi:hypothetical protein
MKHSSAFDLLNKARAITRSFAGKHAELLATMRAAGYDTFADALQSELARYADCQAIAYHHAGISIKVGLRGFIPEEGDDDAAQQASASTWRPTVDVSAEGESFMKVKARHASQAATIAAHFMSAVKANENRSCLIADLHKALQAL